MTIIERTLYILLLGAILWSLDNQERRIQDLDRRVTKLENSLPVITVTGNINPRRIYEIGTCTSYGNCTGNLSATDKFSVK